MSNFPDVLGLFPVTATQSPEGVVWRFLKDKTIQKNILKIIFVIKWKLNKKQYFNNLTPKNVSWNDEIFL